MDDLSSLDWSASSNSNSSKPNPPKTTTTPAFISFPAIRPTPSPFASGRSTPVLSTQGSGTIAPKSNNNPFSKPAQDSFSNLGSLVNFGSSSAQSIAKLSLKEQQERLEAERRRKEEERRQQLQTQYGGLDALGQLGSGGSNSRTTSPAFGLGGPTSIPSPAISSRVASPLNPTTLNQLNMATKKPSDSDDDLFAAFKAETKVDNASHYPPPTVSSPPPVTGLTASAQPRLDLSDPSAWGAPKPSTPVPVPAPAPAPVSTANTAFAGLDDDDPFGLGEFSAAKTNAPPPAQSAPAFDEEDDLLGDLAKPVDQVKKQQQQLQQLQQQQQRQPQPQAARPSFSQRREPGKPIEDDEDSSSSDEEPERSPRPSDDPFDRAVAQLVDYGFTPENARRGLTESSAGLNVQAAVNWLLDDAHRQAKEEARAKNGGGGQQHTGRSEERAGRGGQGGPSWMREEQEQQAERSRSRDNRSPASLAEVDFAKTAAAVGTSLFKTANSLWKTGQKKVQEAVKEFQHEGGDPNQPKWMREAAEYEQGGRRPQAPDVTDEAMMLEGGGRPARRPESTRERPAEPRTASNGPQRNSSPVPRWQQQAPPRASPDPRSRLSKQAIEEQSSQAYVSPARRKKATPQPQPEAPPPAQFEDEDLLFGSSGPSKSQTTTTTTLPSRPVAKSTAPAPPAPRRSPAAPPRQIPPISAIALQSSTKHRLEGTAHFKRGDYAAAHTSYGASLSAIPSMHPLAILLLCNRALTALKVGEPRQAVQDADAAMALIGPSKGEGESVEVQTSEHGPQEKRDMRDLYGKALTRKAEALEQMEKWADAEKVWQSAVEAGLGGQTAAAGRQRCQKALAPKPAAAVSAPAVKKPSSAPARPRPTPSAAASTSQKSSEAVQRLRLANQAAEKEGSEKFALADKVDARIASWRDGKKDNLRALLASLDNVLWEGSGWKKVGLHELVVANKVKIVYMKAIAKCHPDKISTDASTEVRMIAGTVFATLNEAWDKFKKENNM
ncbi:auxilin-like clathrin-binding protein required for normal clathrin function [Neurospora sp. IMI 360204]|nr:auxilin-like clathrin-binding protein required for normal clathrin function [Neurospora sp. IMI 360204]